MPMKLWAKKVYEYMSSQDDYDFSLLGPEKVNSIKLGNVYMLSIELSRESKLARNRFVWASGKVNPAITYKNELSLDK